MLAPDLIQHYGYAAIAIGTFFEGEMIVLAAGVAAGAGLLTLPGIIAAGMAGVFASDTVCFLLGRLAGYRLARWFPRLYGRLDGAFQLIERHDDKLIVFFQFFPGLATVTPVAFGMTRVHAGRFMALDLAGNALWTGSFSLAGYVCGSALILAFAGLPFWIPLVGWAAVAATVAWFALRRRGPSVRA